MCSVKLLSLYLGVLHSQAKTATDDVQTGRPVLAYNADFDERLIERTVIVHDLLALFIDTVFIMGLFTRWVGKLNAYGSFRWHTLSDAVPAGVKVQDLGYRWGSCGKGDWFYFH